LDLTVASRYGGETVANVKSAPLGMIRKSAKRLSDKIMPKKEAKAR
jgi:hypothetical protein